LAKNLMTVVQNKMTDIYKRVDAKLKDYGGDMPYGVRKMTPTEQRQRYENLTPEGLMDLRNQYGEESVNKWLGKFMKEVQ